MMDHEHQLTAAARRRQAAIAAADRALAQLGFMACPRCDGHGSYCQQCQCGVDRPHAHPRHQPGHIPGFGPAAAACPDCNGAGLLPKAKQ